MSQKMKSICFVGQNLSTCTYITHQLNHFFSEYIDITSWCLQNKEERPRSPEPDLFLFSSKSVLNSVRNRIPEDSNILVADRTLNIENLDRLIELKRGMSTLVVGSSPETAQLSIDILDRFGFGYLNMTPWSLGESVGHPTGHTDSCVDGAEPSGTERNRYNH